MSQSEFLNKIYEKLHINCAYRHSNCDSITSQLYNFHKQNYKVTPEFLEDYILYFTKSCEGL